MFILNQNRDAIVNTDNIIEIYAIGTAVRYQDTTIQFGFLGTYPDSVRAAEIVRDIFKCFDNTVQAVMKPGVTDTTLDFAFPKNIYEMPEE